MSTIIETDSQYFNALSHVFTPIVLDSVAEKGYSDYLTEVCSHSGLMDRIDESLSFFEFLEEVFSFLTGNYQNEYIFKNTIAKKLLLEKHSVDNSRMLTEFRVGKNRADVVILNGTSTVYEIKSRFDSFARLNDQLSTYQKVFDHINIVTTPDQAKKLIPIIPIQIGILSLGVDNEFSLLRESISNKHHIENDVLFDSLRKSEYISIIESLTDTVPNVPNTRIFAECKKLFCQIEPEVVHEEAVKVLKNRCDAERLMSFIGTAPKSLIAFIISNINKKTKLQALSQRYSMRMGDILGVC